MKIILVSLSLIMLVTCYCNACVKVERNGIYTIDRYGDRKNPIIPDIKIEIPKRPIIKK